MSLYCLASKSLWSVDPSGRCVVHRDAAQNSPVPFDTVMDFTFPVKGVTFTTLSLMIPPLFGLTALIGVYRVAEYFLCICPLGAWCSMSPSNCLLGGGGCDNLRLTCSEIFSIGTYYA